MKMMPHEMCSHWIMLIYCTLLLFSIYIILKHLRYDLGREVILNLFCLIQGRRYKWVREPSLARRVLSSSASKGLGIEHFLSTQAFRPIVSLESASDSQWIRMKDNFLVLKSHLPTLESLSLVTEEATTELLKNPEISVIDSPTLARLVVQIMQTWLFNNSKEVDSKVILAIEEWRKEIAVKGQGNRALKMYAICWIQKLLVDSKYWEIFGDRWYGDEYWSLVLQPFFVSPVINITDLAVTLTDQKFKRNFLKNFGKIANSFDFEKKSDMEQVIISAINYSHPFPILERWFPNGLKDNQTQGSDSGWIIEPNTHVFVPMDQIGQSVYLLPPAQSMWSAFGAGKRACGGRDVGLTLCTKMFSLLLSKEEEVEVSFRPWEGHNYSGRNNDLKETWSQTSFQLKILAKILWKLVFNSQKESIS